MTNGCLRSRMINSVRSAWSSTKLQSSPRGTQISHFCSNEGPPGDCFWLLDVFMLLAGVHHKATSRWTAERFICYSINILFAYQVFVAILQLIHAFKNDTGELTGIVFHTIKESAIIVAGAKLLLILYFQSSIRNVRDFITGSRINSGDPTFDEMEHTKFNQSVRKMMRLLFAVFITDAVLLCTPCTATEKLFTLPPPLSAAGPMISPILHICSAQLLFLGAVPKFFSNMACIGALIIGMRTKLKILAHQWNRILNHPLETPKCYFERMDREVRIILDQQMDYWRQLQTLKTLVEKSFFIVHVYSLYSIGSCIFVARELGVNVLTGVIYATSLAYLTKHYLWCHLVDSFKDVADGIGYEISSHCTQMPYSRQYHRQYVQMKITLIIVWNNTVNGVSMKSMGMIVISRATFVDLLKIIYTVLTFFINMT